MSKHEVICVKCGRKFDANHGARYYTKSRRYMCKSCVAAQKREQKERSNASTASHEENTGMRQGKTAMIVKVVIGILFLLGSFPLVLQGNFPAFICGLCVAAWLIAWGLVPYFKTRE